MLTTALNTTSLNALINALVTVFIAAHQYMRLHHYTHLHWLLHIHWAPISTPITLRIGKLKCFGDYYYLYDAILIDDCDSERAG
jgi:hypothetical protein